MGGRSIKQHQRHGAPALSDQCIEGAAQRSQVHDFEADAGRAGLVLEQRYSTWTLRPPASDFLVAVLSVGV